MNQAPQVKAIPDSSGRSESWTLTLWVGEPFDFNIPFRAILQAIVAKLSISASCELRMPSYRKGEDFVQGQIEWGADTFDVYYEYSLAYLDLSSSDQTALERLSRDLSSLIVLAPKHR